MVVVVGFGLSPLTTQTNMDYLHNSVTESQNLIFKSAFAESHELDNNDDSGQLKLVEVTTDQIVMAFVISAILIIVIVSVYKIIAKRPLKEIILNDKGYPTLSKFQFLLWTIVIAFTFFSITTIIVIGTDYSTEQDYFIKDVPENLLAMMGISVAVPIVASSKTRRTKKIKKQDDSRSFGAMFLNLQGNLDLARLQMFLWTIIGISIYLHTVFDEILTVTSSGELFLPDVSPTLLILMGLSQGAYLGSKFVGGNPQENDSVSNASENSNNS